MDRDLMDHIREEEETEDRLTEEEEEERRRWVVERMRYYIYGPSGEPSVGPIV